MGQIIPYEVVKSMLDKIIKVECDEKYSPRSTCVSRARKEYVSALGDVIHAGDYYYYVQSVGVMPYVSVLHPPIAYHNMLYAPGTTGYRTAMTLYNEAQEKIRRAALVSNKLKVKDECIYNGRRCIILDSYRSSKLTSPFFLLYDMERKEYIADRGTGAITMVAACYCSRVSDTKKFACYQVDEEFEAITCDPDNPFGIYNAKDIIDACEYFCEQLGDNFMYDEETHECEDGYGNKYLVKEIE